MLKLRPTREHCNKVLPPNSSDTGIGAYARDVLHFQVQNVL